MACRSCPAISVSAGYRSKSHATPEVLEVHIPKGAPNGHKLKFSEKGNEIPDGDAGDVVIQLEEQPHDRFKRKGDDLYIERTISLSEALMWARLHPFSPTHSGARMNPF